MLRLKVLKASSTAANQLGALVLKPGLRAGAAGRCYLVTRGGAQVSRTKRRVFADDGCDADGRGLIGYSQKGPIELTDCLFTLSDQTSSQMCSAHPCKPDTDFFRLNLHEYPR